MITDDRLKHMIGVARKCYTEAKDNGIEENEARAIFIMGLLHDVGYEFTDSTEEHVSVGYSAICNLSDDMLNAVKEHGNPNVRTCGEYLSILNKADLTVDSKGNSVDMETRLCGLKLKYGENSKEYIDALNVIRKFNF